MNSQLSPEQIEHYRLNGFLVIEDFLTADELARWRETTEDAVQERLAASRVEGSEWRVHNTNQGDPESYYARVFTQCVKLADTHADMHDLIFDPTLGRMAATLAGIEGIRVWHDQALFKQPFGNPTGWHLDNPFWSFSSPDSLSIWIALDDAALANGCLFYLPGTHKTARYDRTNIGENMADLFRMYPEWRQIEPVACPCPAGSAVLHNGLTAHGAGANMTNKPRRAMTCAYMPDGATYNGQPHTIVFPPEYTDKLQVGDLLNDDAYVPLLWHA